MIRAVQALWTGQFPLAQAFWRYGIVGGLLVSVTTLILVLALLTAGVPAPFVILVFVLHLPYNLLTLGRMA